jgi:hypothetical protein
LRNQIPLQHYLKLKQRNASSLLTETQNAFLCRVNAGPSCHAI